MQAWKTRPAPPRPRPYNATSRKKPTLKPLGAVRDEDVDAEWDLVTLDEPDVTVEEITEIRVRSIAATAPSIPPLPPITEWLDLDLPLPIPRPRPRT